MDAAGNRLLAGVAEIVVAPDPGAETLKRLVGNADVLVVRTHLPADLFDRPHRLLGVVRHGTGLDMIPVQAATAQALPVANVPGVNAEAVAEYCFGSLLRAFARSFDGGVRKPIIDKLPYLTGGIEFEFAVPEYTRRPLLRIETRIDGLDRDWLPAGPGSRRELTAIRDGRYTVRARVVAETGVVSTETTFSFEVLPPWWRTTPMALALLLAAAPAAYGKTMPAPSKIPCARQYRPTCRREYWRWRLPRTGRS